MAPGFSEYLVEEPAGSVDNRGLLPKGRRASHKPGKRKNPLDPIKGPEPVAQDGQGVERADAGGCRPVLHADVDSEKAGAREPAVDSR